MQTHRQLFILSILLLTAPCQAQAPVSVDVTIQKEREGRTNRVYLSWEGHSNAFFRVWTVRDLNQAWGLMTWRWSTNSESSLQVLRVAETNIQASRFYKVVQAPIPNWLTNSPSTLLMAARRHQLVHISPGTFLMGSPTNEAERQFPAGDETQHEVTISKGFWMGRFEVTQREYLEMIGNNPSWFKNETPPLAGGVGDPVANELALPVDEVSWMDATNYCALLTER